MRIGQGAAWLVLAGTLATSPAWGQGYPNRVIRVIVPFPGGSSTDIVARSVADGLGPALGQTLVIENKPGAGGRIGAEFVARAAPDGYTVMVQSSAHTVNPALYPDLPYDTLKDFAGVTPLAALPNVLIVPPGRFKSAQELVGWARANPGKLNIASAGVGSATHMNTEKFAARAGFKFTHVPFKGTPEIMTELMNGRVDAYFGPLNAVLPFIQDKRVVALAVGTEKRSAVLADVPTTIEAGVPDSAYNFWLGLLVPAKTPRDIVDKLNTETVKVLQSPQLVERFRTLGASPMPMTPSEFDAYIKAELASIGQIVKAAGIKAN
jgi:tripartite-type tricarboxylate transporter receptor subunit TctC